MASEYWSERPSTPARSNCSGAIWRGGDLGFALEALGGVGAVGELQRQDLERDGAVELGFVGAVDEGHAAAAQELVDLELAAQVALQGALQLFGHGRLGRLVGDEGAAAVGAHDRVTGDVAGVAARADHAFKLRHREVCGGGWYRRRAVGVAAKADPDAAPASLIAGLGAPVVAPQGQRDTGARDAPRGHARAHGVRSPAGA